MLLSSCLGEPVKDTADSRLKSHFLALSNSVKSGKKSSEDLYKLANCYYFGIGVEEDKGKALELFLDLANSGNSDAALSLAYNALVSNKNLDETFRWLNRSSELGNKRAENFSNYLVFGAGLYNFDISLPSIDADRLALVEKKAKEGDSASRILLGGLCEDKKDYNSAFCRYKKAAESGHSEAQLMLGESYYYGRGVEADIKKAVSYFSEAAEYFLPEGEYWLATCLFKGEGVERDLVKSYILFKRAAMQGNKEAREKLASF